MHAAKLLIRAAEETGNRAKTKEFELADMYSGLELRHFPGVEFCFMLRTGGS